VWQPDLCDDDGTVETATTGATWECDDVGNWFGSLRKKEEEKDDLRGGRRRARTSFPCWFDSLTAILSIHAILFESAML